MTRVVESTYGGWIVVVFSLNTNEPLYAATILPFVSLLSSLLLLLLFVLSCLLHLQTVELLPLFFRSKRKERYECEKGWFSNDDIACDYGEKYL